MKPKIVIQIYKSRLVLSKEDRGFQNRPVLKWPDHIESSTTKIEDSCVRFISSLDFSTTESFTNSEFLVALDYHPETKIPKNQFYDDLDEVSFNSSNLSRFKFDIFEFEKMTSDQVNLFFNGTNLGVPKRQSFQIASLSPNSPVRIKINWKSDFSFSRGKERQFYELDYIVEFKGIFETFLRESTKTETFLKDIQISNCKEIDLRKILN
ncbi:hypothetical protein L9Z41_18125 [Leptospira noguchii]|uniref:hypothetical protein n=1 Tax=Leptospira noguchii TaxID=28182 RepID=UPI001F06C6B5|nr:hypothetical protein [Leptospira noguchii]MCH1911997.1 hypothetical protein [Leptospira noguchii]MCH1917489.1 hypothetical protein [Leptospira noguchii]UOG63130.1 hypothetical protein MAL04_12255 [Leptospira noguchii]